MMPMCEECGRQYRFPILRQVRLPDRIKLVPICPHCETDANYVKPKKSKTCIHEVALGVVKSA